MNILKVDLNPLQKQNKYQSQLFILMGCIYIVIGIINFSSEHKLDFIGCLWFISGLFFFIGSYYTKKHTMTYFIEINENMIKFKQSISNARIIKLNTIKEIHIKPISIDFLLNNNQKESLSLGNVGYKNVLEVKAKLKELAQINGIVIE